MKEWLALAGILLSVYALHVKRRSGRDDYTPLCDINEHISCTKAFTHTYGTTLKVHNGWLGVIYYTLVFAVPHPSFFFIIATIAMIKTFQLAYLSYWKMRNFCLVCTATYIINAWLFLIAV